MANYDVTPSGPHPPNLLELLCNFQDLRHMQGSLKAVHLNIDIKYACFSIFFNININFRHSTIDSDVTFKHFIEALQHFADEKCIYNNCEVTLYSKVVPVLWMATKDLPGYCIKTVHLGRVRVNYLRLTFL